MLDRALKLIVTLTLLLFLVEAIIDVLCRVLGAALAHVFSVLCRAGSLVAVGAICLLAGLLIRWLRWLREGGLTGRRPHLGNSTRQEWAGRKFADDVPVHQGSRRARSRRQGAARGTEE